MYVNQLGKKKKKQAVRRLSQSSGGQGNRKEDIRRRLGAKRRVDVAGSEEGERKFPRGRLRQEHPEGARPFAAGANRNLERSQTTLKRHISPLANAGLAQGAPADSGNTHPGTSTENKNETQKVFGSNVFQSRSAQGNLAARNQSKNPTLGPKNTGVVKPQQQGQNVLRTRSVQANERLNEAAKTKTHPSPLAGLMSGASNAGGSVTTGLSTQATSSTGSRNVASLVEKYEQTKAPSLPSFQTSSGNIFQPTGTSQIFAKNTSHEAAGFPSTNPAQVSNIFSLNKDTHSSQPPSTSTIFGNNPSISAPPNVNLFHPKEYATSVSRAQNSANKTGLFTGAAITGSKTSIFGNNMTPTSGNVLKPSTNLVGSTYQATGSYGGVFGNPGSPRLSTHPPRPSTQVPRPSTRPPRPSTQQTNSPNIFSTSNIPATSVQNSLQNKPIIFGGAGMLAPNTNSAPQTIGVNVDSNQRSSIANAVDQRDSKGPFISQVTNPGPSQSSSAIGIFGNPGLQSASSTFPRTSGVFSTRQDPKGLFTSQVTDSSSSQSSKSTGIFGTAGLPVTSSTISSTGIFSASHVPRESPFSISQVTSLSSSQSKSAPISFATASQPSSFTLGSVFSGRSNETFGNVASTTENDSVFPRVPNANSQSAVGASSKAESEQHKVNPKSLKRSLSNPDVINLTAIVIKGLTGEFLNKKLLEREFTTFGPNKITLQPTKQSAVLTFATHESARKAKSKAQELFPSKDTGVYWYKKKGRLSKTPEKATPRSRRMSITNALNSIDIRTFPAATSAQERFAVLDEVDKRIRQAITPYTDMASAPVVVGVCCDMCPEKERYMREFQANLSVFEMVPGTQDNRDGEVPKVEHAKAIKEYSRSAADKLEPLAHELRPVRVLQMTLDYLMANVMDNSEGKWRDWFNFLWNRTRAIRKDITQQHLCDVQSADLVEKITRFHIFCAHYLCEEDIHSFDPKINNENLTKCLQTLKQFYVDLYVDQEMICPNEGEFQAYDILLNLNEGDTLRKAMQYRLEVRNSPEVKFALEIFGSLNSNNYVRFFKLLKSASYLNACIMHRYFTQVRGIALQVMIKAYSPKEPYPLVALQDLLAFEDKDETAQFCSHYKLTTTEESVKFSKMSFIDPESAFSPHRAVNVIESKRSCSVGEIVNGSPLQQVSAHQPTSSFDANARYIGLANLVQLLGNTPDTPEPESPCDSYETPANLLSEQRSPVVTVPGEDLQVIFKRAVEDTCKDLLEQTVHGLLKDISNDAIRQVGQLQITEIFADKFIDEIVGTVLKEIAKECIENELEVKRRKIATADSQARMTVVVVHEIINEVLKTEVVSLVEDAKRVIRQQLKAQSFTKMSAIIMREMLEDVMHKQCHDIAVTTRKEMVRQKKAMLWKRAEILRRNQLKRCFKSWSKEYQIRLHIRTILQEIPAKPPMLTTKQQLEKLLSNKDSTQNMLRSPSSYANLIKEREEVQTKLSDMMNDQELKRLRAMEPIDMPRLYAELKTSELMPTRNKHSQNYNCMKMVVSFPSYVQDFSSESVENLIKLKLRAENPELCLQIPAELQGKIEQLSQTPKTSSQTREFKHDIKACYGVLSTNELRRVQREHLLLGTTGILFVLNSSDQIRDKMFWNKCRERLRQILRSKPPVPRIPLAIMNINTKGNECCKDNIEEQLGIDGFRNDELLADCVVYVQDVHTDSDELHKQLVHAILWLISHSPQRPPIEKDTLKGFVEKEILRHFTTPVYEETAIRKEASLQPQCPEVIVELYNSVIDHVIAVVTNHKLTNVSLPIPEFISLEDSTNSPPVSWNSTATLNRLHGILRKLKLPLPSSPASNGTWHSEHILCLDYVNVLLAEEPFKTFGFALINRVERIFSPYARNSGDLSTLTAADLPWPDVIDACIKTLLSWLHALSDGTVKNVYYFPQDLNDFKEPPLWTDALPETFILAEATSPRKKKKTTKLCDLTTAVDEELTRIETSRSRLDLLERDRSLDDEMEETAGRFQRTLEREKRNWKRFEEKLRSMLDEEDAVRELTPSASGQGLKRKNPSWSVEFRPDKTNVKKGSVTGLEDVDLPDMNSTFNYFETSLISLQDSLKFHRHLEERTERKLKEALEGGVEQLGND